MLLICNAYELAEFATRGDMLLMLQEFADDTLRSDLLSRVTQKKKVFPYSLPSVGPGADPGVQAVSPQVT